VAPPTRSISYDYGVNWDEIRDAVTGYVDSVEAGRTVAGRWIYAACRRFRADMQRADIYMDWTEVAKLQSHFASLQLIAEDSGKAFELRPWQLWVMANLWGWRWRADGRRRVKIGILQVARGNGKTTMAAGLAVYDLLSDSGRRVHVVANNETQAGICLETAQTMMRRKALEGVKVLWDRIEITASDCLMTALPALERALDGLNPSFWIADEAAEFRGRFLTKLLTTGSKRKESLGLIITTPGSNPENIYGEMVANAEAILKGEVEDDTVFAALYGIDPADTPDDEAAWPKANPGMEYQQPARENIRRSWNTMKRSPMGRSEFIRYHCARTDENTGGWLDMEIWPGGETPDMDALRGRPAWLGLDLSKSLDMTALMVAVPLDDGRVALKGHYWWPAENVRQRELDYRMPVRTWAADKRITLTPGREIDYESVRMRINDLRDQFDLRAVGYDAWGSKYLVECLEADGVPMTAYRMGISTFAPGCQLFQNLWAGGKLIVGDDPILRRACAEARAQQDRNGNVRPVKSRENCIIDPLVSAIIAVHCWGGKRASCYESDV
jgi:phage terminase large subunit-like protein